MIVPVCHALTGQVFQIELADGALVEELRGCLKVGTLPSATPSPPCGGSTRVCDCCHSHVHSSTTKVLQARTHHSRPFSAAPCKHRGGQPGAHLRVGA